MVQRVWMFLVGVFGLMGLALGSAYAVGPDFSTLTTDIDFSTVSTAVLAVAALMVVPKVAAWGARKVIGFIRG